MINSFKWLKFYDYVYDTNFILAYKLLDLSDVSKETKTWVISPFVRVVHLHLQSQSDAYNFLEETKIKLRP